MDYSEKIEGRININRIDILSTTDFKETVIRTLNPYSDSPYPDRIHTLCMADDFTIIDGCNEAFIFRNFYFLFFKIKQIIKNMKRNSI